MNTNKKITLDASKLYGFKIANHPFNQQQPLPVVIGSKIGKGPTPVINQDTLPAVQKV